MSNPPSKPSTPLFGAGASTGNTPSLFGQTQGNTSTNTSSAPPTFSFGAPAGGSGTNLFGNQQAKPGGLFGFSSTPSSGTASGGGVFGGAQPNTNPSKPSPLGTNASTAPSFGNTGSAFGSGAATTSAGSSNSLFGSLTTPTSAGGNSNIFGGGATTTSADNNKPLFGGAATAPATGNNTSGGFGGIGGFSGFTTPPKPAENAGSKTQQPNLFGNISSPGGSSAPLGSTTPATTKPGGLFGNLTTTPAGPPPGGFLGGGNQAQKPASNMYSGLGAGQSSTNPSSTSTSTSAPSMFSNLGAQKPLTPAMQPGSGNASPFPSLTSGSSAPAPTFQLNSNTGSTSATPGANTSTTGGPKSFFNLPGSQPTTSNTGASTPGAPKSLFGDLGTPTSTSAPGTTGPGATAAGTPATSAPLPGLFGTTAKAPTPSLFNSPASVASAAPPAPTFTLPGASTAAQSTPSTTQPAPTFKLPGPSASAATASTTQPALNVTGASKPDDATKPSSNLGASSQGPRPSAQSRLKNKSMDEIITKWATDLSKYQKEFQNQAQKVQLWDKMLVENSGKIQLLYGHTLEAERATTEVERQLTSVENDQRELEAWIDNYEKQVDEMTASQGGQGDALTGPDQERERTYKLADQLTARLNDMGKDLTSIIEEINDASSNLSKSKADDPLSQIVRILNGHLSQLQQIDQGAAELQSKVTAAQKSRQSLGMMGSGLDGLRGNAADEFSRTWMGRR